MLAALRSPALLAAPMSLNPLLVSAALRSLLEEPAALTDLQVAAVLRSLLLEEPAAPGPQPVQR